MDGDSIGSTQQCRHSLVASVKSSDALNIVASPSAVASVVIAAVSAGEAARSVRGAGRKAKKKLNELPKTNIVK